MTHKAFRLFFVLILIIGLVVVSAPQSARAAGPWYVSPTGSDANDCLSPGSACATINGALNKPGFVAGDTIRVAIGTYTGTGNEVVLLDRDATLSGGWNATFTTQSGISTVDGEGSRRGISVNSGVTATVEHFTLQNGNVTGNGGGILNAGTLTFNESNIINNTAGRGTGSGIYNTNTGDLTMNNSTVSLNGSTETCFVIANEGTFIANNTVVEENTTSTRGCVATIVISFSGTMTMTNTAIRNNPIGGGLYNYATLTLNNSVVSGNIGGGFNDTPGGIYNFFGSMYLNNSTISGNTTFAGGGIFTGGGGEVILTNSTVTNNSADSGGGIYNFPSFPSNIFLRNTIVAGNIVFSTGPECMGTLISTGYNLIGNDSDCTYSSAAGDQVGTSVSPIDPLLGPLQNNGGFTDTHALLSGSSAINTGNPAGCTDPDGNPLTTDQRGVTRPQGPACDIGAFELEATGGVREVTIDIKPGNKHNRIMIGAGGSASVQVAILSTADFNAPAQVDKNSLTFGATGDENSLRRRSLIGTPDCRVRDVNRDRIKDLVCSFLIGKTGFKLGDTVGILKGQTVDGTLLEGRDLVLITAPSYPSYPSYP